jgi:hypothetical protein
MPRWSAFGWSWNCQKPPLRLAKRIAPSPAAHEGGDQLAAGAGGGLEAPQKLAAGKLGYRAIRAATAAEPSNPTFGFVTT